MRLLAACEITQRYHTYGGWEEWVVHRSAARGARRARDSTSTLLRRPANFESRRLSAAADDRSFDGPGRRRISEFRPRDPDRTTRPTSVANRPASGIYPREFRGARNYYSRAVPAIIAMKMKRPLRVSG